MGVVGGPGTGENCVVRLLTEPEFAAVAEATAGVVAFGADAFMARSQHGLDLELLRLVVVR